MKKVLAYGGMILLFVLLQCSFFTHLSLADVVPNLLIILTASIAIINGSLEGCLVGFFSGLLLDLMFGPYIGMYAFGYLLCGYLTGIGNRIFYKEDITFPVRADSVRPMAGSVMAEWHPIFLLRKKTS